MKNGKGNEHPERYAVGWAIVVTLASLIYAIVRYNIFGNVPLEYIPLYVSSKGISVASVALIGMSLILGPLARFWPRVFATKFYLRKYFGLLGFGLAALHSLISLMIFSPAYYPRFFEEGGKLTAAGELSMMFGVIALFIFSIVAITSLPSVEKTMGRKRWLDVQRAGYMAFALVGLHVFAMGYKGWTQMAAWPGGLPPITLLAFVIVAFVILMRLLAIVFPRRTT
ncbi:MAG: ferric reductase-like transmembrane domain-containing protein [Candidatus Aenigmarchaeota archaeon]|nr:ferric reductase-like transmembrane domain-containing protein [Candidatus Aenigmarchaeota archaeon]